jgi:phosphomannomutase
MSSTKSLKELALASGGQYASAAVGEVNVVAKMKEVNAVIGGEGNGGVIVPDFHYGRDALIGIGLFLTHLAQSGKKISALRKRYPDYFISKNKIELQPGTDLASIFSAIQKKYAQHPLQTDDGLKIEFDNDWVHLRSSNTEPIIRIYAESDLASKASHIAQQLMRDIKEFSQAVS